MLFKEFLWQHKIIGPVLVAVSGGPDSIALLHLLGGLHQELKLEPEVIHYNHGLRGRESDLDEQFVQELSKKWQFPLHVGRASSTADSASGCSEEKLRDLRYQFFQQVAEQRHISSILLAHHRDDQLETILQRFLRGTGLRGWQGIPAQRSLNDAVQIYRPLLSVPKSELITYLKIHQLAYRTDASNQLDIYTRNRIRNELIPLLESIDPGACQQILNWQAQASEIQQCHQQLLSDLLQQALLSQTAEEVRLRLSPLQSAPAFLVTELLIEIWEQQRWPRGKMTREHWGRVQLLIQQGAGSQNLPGKISCQIRGTALVIKNETAIL